MKRFFNSIMEKLIKDQKGQSSILFVLFAVFLVGFVAIVVDVGVYAASKNSMQNAVDAATLAAVQELPDNPTKATAFILKYLNLNGINVEAKDVNITISDQNHSINAVVNSKVPTFFARILGVQELKTRVHSKAMVGFAASVPWIVPFVIPQPIEFNYDKVYVMRMYGSGPYPSGYSYPNDYKTNSVYKKYPLGDADFYSAIGKVILRDKASNSGKNLIEIPDKAKVTYITSTIVASQTWYKVTYSNKTGYVRKEQLKFNDSLAGVYPYQFDYMNVYIKKNTGFSEYVNWLENGYHETFSVDETMSYYAPSSGGKTSVDAFAKRVSRDSNTDYTKAKVGDGRVILIPIVQQLLPRNTKDRTPMSIIGFTAFFIQTVHKNSYEESFWFDGRFLENIEVSGDVTFDPNANFGLKVVKLTE